MCRIGFLRLLVPLSRPTFNIDLLKRIQVLRGTELLDVLHSGHLLLLFVDPQPHPLQRDVRPHAQRVQGGDLRGQTGKESNQLQQLHLEGYQPHVRLQSEFDGS